MVTLVLGTIEITNMVRVQSKLNVTVGQLAEFVAGQSSLIAGQPSGTVTAGTLADLCTGAAMNLAPYPVSTLSADIVSLSVDHPSNRETVRVLNCPYWWYCYYSTQQSTDSTTVKAYLDWENTSSCATTDSSPLTLTGAFPLANSPTSLLTKSGAKASDSSDQSLKYGYSAIVVQVQYSYSNVLKFFLGQTMNFTAYAVARPRSNATIRCTDSSGASC